ncbi:hypothetical protein [Bacillus cereus]|uniref:Uncharacterized protein n=2 Tax=Bacillus cereus group TaxID=86661 RepID=J8FUP3_BACCE|nr:hypothetical protein [Bacillus cereus]EJR04396.1 hypothetical protein II3_00330 [Bacillus cereus MC67]EOP12065.1 hypothetical protein II1_03539 [Bacillus cereus MC118]
MKIPKIIMVILVVISVAVGLMGPYSIKEKIIYTFGVIFWGAMAIGAINLMEYIKRRMSKRNLD